MLKVLACVLSLFILFSASVFASGFQLKAIGALDVTGAVSKEWWYSNANPALSGITTAGSTVTVKIDDVDYQATVDGSGNWSYIPTTLSDGDHSVVLTSSAGSQSFTLHIGAVPADVTAPTQQSTPVVGTTEQSLALWLGGAIIMIAGLALLPIKK
jgi:hypothetical protein